MRNTVLEQRFAESALKSNIQGLRHPPVRSTQAPDTVTIHLSRITMSFSLAYLRYFRALRCFEYIVMLCNHKGREGFFSMERLLCHKPKIQFDHPRTRRSSDQKSRILQYNTLVCIHLYRAIQTKTKIFSIS